MKKQKWVLHQSNTNGLTAATLCIAPTPSMLLLAAVDTFGTVYFVQCHGRMQVTNLKEKGKALECQDFGDVVVAAIFASAHDHSYIHLHWRRTRLCPHIGNLVTGVSMFASLDNSNCSKLKWRPP